MKKKFSCDRCGACCRQLFLFGPAYNWLDDGTGRCRYFDMSTHLCTVYPVRPLICRVEEGYPLLFSHISWDDYIEQSMYACKLIKKLFKEKEISKIKI